MKRGLARLGLLAGLVAVAVLFGGCAVELAAVGSLVAGGERVLARVEDVGARLGKAVLKVRHLRERACDSDNPVVAWARARIRERAAEEGVDPDDLRRRLCGPQ